MGQIVRKVDFLTAAHRYRCCACTARACGEEPCPVCGPL